MSTRTGDSRRGNREDHVPLRPTRFVLLQRAQEAIDFLLDRDGSWSGSKNQFALMMSTLHGSGWERASGSPDRELVERVCTLTRDQDMDPMVKEVLGGYVIAYSPSQGGMTLIEPEREVPLNHQLHILTGDMQRQQAMRTINRRRVTVWRAVAEAAAATGDQEVARLAWQAENQISSTGFVSEVIQAEWFKVMASRDMFSEVPT